MPSCRSFQPMIPSDNEIYRGRHEARSEEDRRACVQEGGEFLPERAALVRNLHIGTAGEDTQDSLVANALETRLHVRQHDVGRARQNQVCRCAILLAALYVAFGKLGRDPVPLDDEATSVEISIFRDAISASGLAKDSVAIARIGRPKSR